MTELEVLEKAITRLVSISVPIMYTEQIAVPIKESTDLLKALYAAVLQNVQKDEHKEESEETAELEDQKEEPEVNQNGSGE